MAVATFILKSGSAAGTHAVPPSSGFSGQSEVPLAKNLMQKELILVT